MATTPLSIISQRIVIASSVNGMLLFGSMWITSFYLPIYFQAVKGVSPTISGVYIFPIIVAQVLFALVSGVLGMHNCTRPI